MTFSRRQPTQENCRASLSVSWQIDPQGPLYSKFDSNRSACELPFIMHRPALPVSGSAKGRGSAGKLLCPRPCYLRGPIRVYDLSPERPTIPRARRIAGLGQTAIWLAPLESNPASRAESFGCRRSLTGVLLVGLLVAFYVAYFEGLRGVRMPLTAETLKAQGWVFKAPRVVAEHNSP